MLCPCCRSRVFFSCGEQGLLSSCSALASHRGSFSYCGAWGLKLWHRLAVVVNGLNCPTICEVFPDWGLKPCTPALTGGFLPTAPSVQFSFVAHHEWLLDPLLPPFLTFLPVEYFAWSSRYKLLSGGSRAEWDPSCIANCITLDKPPHLLNGSHEKDFVHGVVKVH